MKVVILAGLLLGTSVYAQSNETTGGGLGAYTSAGLKLYDLVDPTTCSWQSGADLLDSNLEVQGYLAKIKKLNWYLEMKLRSEIQTLDFCWTKGQLKEPVTGAPPALMVYQTIAHVPVGIRLFNTKSVYVQSDRYQEMGPNDRALFIIHEALHSFIPLNATDRYHCLENMVVSISKIQGDPARESRSFNTTIKRSQLTIPSDVNFISDQNFLQYAFANYEDRKTMILNSEIMQNELLRKRDYEYMASLPLEDQDYLKQVKTNTVQELLSEFCKADDAAVIQKLDTQATDNFTMSLYCITTPGYLNRAVNNSTQNTTVLNNFIADFYAKLFPVFPSIKNNRVIVTKNIDVLSGNPAINPQYRVALEVKPAFQLATLTDAHPRLLQYAKVLTTTASMLTVDEWIKLVDQNNSFGKAFNFRALEIALNVLRSPIKDECEASALNLKAVYLGAIKGVIQMLRNENMHEHADRLTKLVNDKNLGIKIGE
jgi:hypothetical protein